VRSALRRTLERHGYAVLEAGSGDDALRVWSDRQGSVNLVITDMVMPAGMNGRELADRLKAARPQLKIIYTSGYADDTLADGSALRASTDFLEKPYRMQEVLRKIRAWLDRP
jgi:two-component system, cell cycle sensor histidine kinase and response regulator CckA